MKLPYVLKNLPASGRTLFQPMLLISLVLHGIVLMLPVSSDSEKAEEQVKVTQLPTGQPLPGQVSANQPLPTQLPATQPLPSPLPATQPLPRSYLGFSPELYLQSTPRRLQSNRPEPTFTRRQSDALLIPRTKPRTERNQAPKKEETQQQPTEQSNQLPSTQQPRRSQSTDQSNQPPSTEQPRRSQSTDQSNQPPSTEQPKRSQSTDQSNQLPSTQQPTNQGIGGDYTALFNQSYDQTSFEAVLAQVKHDYKLKEFESDGDINKLKEPDKFKDAKGNLDTKFKFREKTEPPLTPETIASSLEEQLKKLGFDFKKGTYGGGPLYEVTKERNFKRYVILAPAEDERGSLTVIFVALDDPR